MAARRARQEVQQGGIGQHRRVIVKLRSVYSVVQRCRRTLNHSCRVGNNSVPPKVGACLRSSSVCLATLKINAYTNQAFANRFNS